MTKIAGWSKELGNHERDMTVTEQAEFDARQIDWNSDAEKLKRIKEIRQKKLNETDWSILKIRFFLIDYFFSQFIFFRLFEIKCVDRFSMELMGLQHHFNK